MNILSCFFLLAPRQALPLGATAMWTQGICSHHSEELGPWLRAREKGRVEVMLKSNPPLSTTPPPIPATQRQSPYKLCFAEGPASGGCQRDSSQNET